MSAEIKARLRAEVLRLGFADCRIAAAKPAAHREVFEQWVADGKYGDMAWMARNLDRRTDPCVVVAGAQAVIVLAMNYFQGEAPLKTDYRIARYAWNEDYHDLIGPKLYELDAMLKTYGGVQRQYVDTGPVLERDFAGESGLGWNGKSTMQIHRDFGTWFFLATIITTLPLEPDSSAKDLCGKCTRCMDACPTGAITAPRRMDARKCISYLTIEHKNSIPIEFRKQIGDRIYGCDDCLVACPWNKFAKVSHEATFQARESVFQMKLREFLSLDDEGFRTLFRKSPIKRIKRPAFLRNVCVALGNVGTVEDLPALRLAAADPHPMISEHAQWAIAELTARNSPGVLEMPAV
ncbi:MAG: Epoxyqueuosine reductase [Verrucomicrobiaceae bacterium]|nr:Epoxyqueuosine reductase [Verrucomicrobiaceae bacterium]